ncbi:universal stress protein [Flindersiella endophytica]
MTTVAGPPIVVGVDGTSESRNALRWAIDEASCRRSPLHVITAYDDSRPMAYSPARHSNELARTTAKEVLDEAVVYASERLAGPRVHGQLTCGNTATALIEASATAGLVVVGSRPKSKASPVVMGTVSSAVAALAHCPVMVVRGGVTRPLPPRVVAGVDDSPASANALAFAVEEAALHGLTLEVVHVWRPFQSIDLPVWTDADAGSAREAARLWLVDFVAPRRTSHPKVSISTEVIGGHPAAILVEQSRSAQLVVVGSHGRETLAEHLLGSVAQSVLHNSFCTVTIVPG